jgi:DNA-binding transcriptional regulator YhcF (GntR family)
MQKMAKENLVEEALISIKNLEEAINENAKEILHSTMKEEISDLVKESLNEANEDDMDMDDSDDMNMDDSDKMDMDDSDDMDMDDSDEMDMDMDMDMDDSDEMDMDMGMDMDDDMDMDTSDEVIDYSDLEDTPENNEMLLQAFKNMKPEDGVIIKKEGELYNFKDGEDEYLLKLDEEEMEEELDEILHEISDDEFVSHLDIDGDDEDFKETEEVVYEITMDEENDEETSESWNNEEYMTESKKSFKAKGMDMGSPNKFKYDKKPNLDLPTKKQKQGTKGVGMGKAKFEYKEGENMDGKMKVVKGKKEETKEASRTLGSGSYFRKGGLPKPRAHSKANLNMESVMEEVEMLRAKNEEYRKALNLFRDKLNEVAVFNSNLAYTTRLFTEHSTSKPEKINILRRFDGIDTLKESKNLYKVIKNELEGTTKGNITESISKVIVDNEPQTGSAQSLIESTTYENPQFLRMKDLMSKLIK